jgi:hypothetical protein
MSAPEPLILPKKLEELYPDPSQRAALWRVLGVAQRLTGDGERAAMLMISKPLPAFEGLTAAQLAMHGRAEDVIRYLESFEGGAAG